MRCRRCSPRARRVTAKVPLRAPRLRDRDGWCFVAFLPIVDTLGTTLRTLAGPAPTSVADYFLKEISSYISPQRPTHAQEADVATALLCLGHASAQAPVSALAPRATPLVVAILTAAKGAKGAALRGSSARALELLAKVLASGNATNGSVHRSGSNAVVLTDAATRG